MAATRNEPLWISLAGAHNVRDLGGLPAAGGVVRPRVLLRGDSLDALTAEDIALLRDDVGLRGVVDLRAPFENPRPADWFSELDISWLHEPLVDFSGMIEPAALRYRAGEELARLYALMLEAAGAGVVRVLRFLVSGGSTPALVHCAAGKDRTGIVVAVLLAAAGAERDAIIADYLATGQRIHLVRAAMDRRAEYAALRGTPSADGGMRAAPALDPRIIGSVLDVLDSADGGVAGFLLANGADAEEIRRWRELLVHPDEQMFARPQLG
ncbi:tyrosine-protein phosphatase [Frankia sp. AgB32]|uniref:tyrosine-protein phosphatase n=1 Tax=Frankia sp. AgB32 TaxID=631119 RepID=UPI00200BE26B|nr:tyrosine-protein phosphatase [Frankia sp. AgB32]MCK9897340.1 tyrosine-protein phosphatase [Frankia sp. AgB32]